MSSTYTKTAWVNGTTPYINAENLNKIEQGIEDAITQGNTNETAIGSLSSTVTSMQAVEDLTSQLTLTNYVNNVQFLRFGHVYYLRFAILSTLPATTWTTLITIPSAYTPTYDVAASHAHFNTANVGKDIEVNVRSTSEVRTYISAALSSGGSATCSACWIK